MEKIRPEDLHDYPPRIICRFVPEENAPKRTICTISLSGLLPLVEFYVSLTALTPKVAVDTIKLQVFTCIVYTYNYSLLYIAVAHVSISGDDQTVCN